MRGNHFAEGVDAERIGSIPAHAGEPWGPKSSTVRSRVYPRACGGTTTTHNFLDGDWGLSPRMRGNQTGAISICAIPGSIPAHAGEPSRPALAIRAGVYGVYPRACGGTVIGHLPCAEVFEMGLSPRMRGNHASGSLTWRIHRQGSIPAHAGEPLQGRLHHKPLLEGLSPRMRGNQFVDCNRPGLSGSGVYPRACGGTHIRPASHGPKGYPRRGNLGVLVTGQTLTGSIPAHAGEPSSW